MPDALVPGRVLDEDGVYLSVDFGDAVLFTGCRADLASFRFATLRDVVFRDCDLSEANFQGARAAS
ncbi:pentapeptide repeat-containing protein [Actinocorallia sp. API 0066]|uniref:pentapeptide repeat-containing protein n=1 Tax=Actinocorallia sp. API 0066 TaxID=2896846 RepID=UPI0027DF385C|nr:pentapeptide repeat-containing protein [Actinocorallia sp. API 0066]